MKNTFYIGGICLMLLACTSQVKEDTVSTQENFFFAPIAPIASGNEDFLLPAGYSYQVLFQGSKDSVQLSDGNMALSKGSNDMLAYIPIEGSSTHGYLYVGHETFGANPVLGDGGGGSILEIKKNDGTWTTVGAPRHVDFSTVGFTVRNCGGTTTPHGTVLTCEELEPMSNAELSYGGKAFQDTSDLTNGMKAWQNQGWVVEIDPASGKALHKLYAMGRYMHEDAHCMPDGKTVYLSDDNDPAVFFKFVADQAGNYTQGALYAFQQSPEGGKWLELPRDMNTMINARKVAINLGATLYMRHEWMDVINDKLYIAETGKDAFDWQPYAATAAAAPHFAMTPDQKGNDPYGRILVFDPTSNRMQVFLQGGTHPADQNTNFSNPDCIVKFERNGKQYLVLSEDLVGTDQNRISAEAAQKGEAYCEVYMVEVTDAMPTVEQIKRFAVAPNGSETTGTCFTPDGKTMFINIQHPAESNKAPFNCSTTLAIEGF